MKNRKLVCIYSHKFAHHRTKHPMLYLICNSMILFTEAFPLRRKSFQLQLISDTSGRYELCLYANYVIDFDTCRLYPQVPIQNSVLLVIFSLFFFFFYEFESLNTFWNIIGKWILYLSTVIAIKHNLSTWVWRQMLKICRAFVGFESWQLIYKSALNTIILNKLQQMTTLRADKSKAQPTWLTNHNFIYRV